MKTLCCVWGFVAFSILGYAFLKETETFISHQDFESNFEIVNHPDEFLPGWSANEVHASGSRVFQAFGEGTAQSNALGIQVIGSFNAEIYIKTTTLGSENLKITFSARTKRNGTGNRPVYLFLSFAHSPNEPFQNRVQIGDKLTFPNVDSEFQFYESLIPSDFTDKEEITIKLEAIYGAGTGSAARLFLDDFKVKINQEVNVSDVRLINPNQIQLSLDRPVHKVSVDQILSSDFKISQVEKITDRIFLLSASEQIKTKVLTFSVNDIEDPNQNPLFDLEVNLDNTLMGLGKVFFLNQDTVQLSFSHYLDPAFSLPPDHYRILGTTPKSVELMERQYQLQIIPQHGFALGNEVTVDVLVAKNEQGLRVENLTETLIYSDGIETIYMPESDRILLVHEHALSPEFLVGSGFSVRDEEGILSPSLQENDASVLELKLSKPLQEDRFYDLTVPIRRDINGFLLSGSTRQIIADFTPPQIQQLSFVSSNEILISFSEDLDPFLKLIPSHYRIEGQIPEEVSSGDASNQVRLKLSFDLIHGQVYELRVESIEDLNRNVIVPTSLDFTFSDPSHVSFKSIIINEVMPAPRAENPLPNSEYIELYHPGTEVINLGGIRLANSRSETTLPQYLLAPKTYVLLTPANQADNFKPFGEVIGLTSWPTLLNGGDEVKLLGVNGSVIDSLSYDNGTYGGAAQAGVGMSLEIINPYLPCNAFGNLKPSTSPKLGTPGSINAIFDESPDLTKPQLLKAMATSPHLLNVVFSKALGPEAEEVDFDIRPSLSVSNVQWDPMHPAEIKILFDQPIQAQTLYEISAVGLRDCVGNAINPEQKSATFMLPSPAERGDVVLNEVLFNPRTGAPKFVEIYNRSHKAINLKNWKLANFTNEMISNRRLVFTEDYILSPYEYLVFTTDSQQLKLEYPKGNKEAFVELSGLPSYPIREGSVIWLDPEENLMEKFEYHESMHHPIVRDPKGVSLERISYEGEVNNPHHWHSASATVGYASPGFKNSQKITPGQVTEEMILISPKVFVPDAPGEQNFTSIQYEVPQSGLVATVRIYSVTGQLIKDIAQNDVWGNKGMYTWNGTDLSHKRVRPGYYIVWVEYIDINLGSTAVIKKTVVVGVK
ncbi:lamin tail domain-containing protein [Pararhodonellum marinum]|uniref:lamin tail domain-containing protein n=1 Tax=Pararhodonellum marinum TaxID=2755358 RepID=UPI00189055ED|nr:lamin tail domain-containing protein [Pararhodonellum marinum]